MTIREFAEPAPGLKRVGIFAFSYSTWISEKDLPVSPLVLESFRSRGVQVDPNTGGWRFYPKWYFRNYGESLFMVDEYYPTVADWDAPYVVQHNVLMHPSWKHTYELLPHVGDRVRLTFADGQKIYFDPQNVVWDEITRTVAMWERMIDVEQ